MKIGVNLWVWGSPFNTDTDLKLIPLAKSLGAEVVEFALEDDGVVDPKAGRRVLEDEALECSVVGPYGLDRDLSHTEAAVRRRGIDYVKRCVDMCAEIGATIFTGPITGVGDTERLSDVERRTHLGHAAESLRQVGDHAGAAGVRLGIEVLNRYEDNLLNTAQQARELVDLAGHPVVGIHLDTFHMNIEETAPGDAVRLAGDKLLHLHASESHRGTPGEGLFPWHEVGSALREIGYQRYAVIEAFHHESPMAPRARVWRQLAESPEALARDGMAFLKAALRD